MKNQFGHGVADSAAPGLQHLSQRRLLWAGHSRPPNGRWPVARLARVAQVGATKEWSGPRHAPRSRPWRRCRHIRLDRPNVGHLVEMFDAIADENEVIATENEAPREQITH